MVFMPTYLYIKQHTITGKLYFGKSSRNLNGMLKYRGSGKYWKDHFKFHGKEHVITLWHQLYDNVFDLVADALSMSKSFDIVNSDSWANLQYENGLDGGTLASDKTKKILSEMRMGSKNNFYGKTHTDESRKLISISQKGISKNLSEDYLEKLIIRMSGENNFNYGKIVPEERRLKQSITMRGRKHTKEHSANQSKAQTFRFDILCHFNITLIKISMEEFSDLFGWCRESCRYSFKKYGKYKSYKLLKEY